MSFHYARERARFKQRWEVIKTQYEQAGMSKESIDNLYDFDWEYFCLQRTYVNHTQSLPDMYFSNADEVSHSTLFQKFSMLCTAFGEENLSGRYAWVDTIENPKLADALKNLSKKDLELLTFLMIEEHSQEELAQEWNCSQNAISKHFLRQKKNFEKIFK